jgi:hypothetical protein
VIFTALLLAQLAPASTVTDELGLAAADAEAVELLVALALDEVAAGAELLPLLHAARPVTAASAAIPPSASWGRLLLVAVPVLSLFIGGELLCFSISRGVRALRGARRKAQSEAATGASTTVKDRGGRLTASA